MALVISLVSAILLGIRLLGEDTPFQTGVSFTLGPLGFSELRE
jgi:hypothetical protein